MRGQRESLIVYWRIRDEGKTPDTYWAGRVVEEALLEKLGWFLRKMGQEK